MLYRGSALVCSGEKIEADSICGSVHLGYSSKGEIATGPKKPTGAELCVCVCVGGQFSISYQNKLMAQF